MAPLRDEWRGREVRKWLGGDHDLLPRRQQRRDNDYDDKDVNIQSSSTGGCRRSLQNRDDTSSGRGNEKNGDGDGNGDNNKGGGRRKTDSENDDDGNDGRSKGRDGGGGGDDGTATTSPSPSAEPTAAAEAATTPPPMTTPPMANPTDMAVSPSSDVLLSTVSSSQTDAVAANPVVTTTIPVVMTIPGADISSLPRAGVEPPPPDSTDLTSATTTSLPQIPSMPAATALADTLPATSAVPNNMGDDGNVNSGALGDWDGNRHKDHDGKHHNGKSKDDGLSPTAERALIATGSIGSFIMVCFVAWLIYRMMKKSGRRKDSDDNWRGSPDAKRRNPLLAKIPFFKRQDRWQALDDSGLTNPRGAPPSYQEERGSNPRAPDFYDTEKGYPQPQLVANAPPLPQAPAPALTPAPDPSRTGAVLVPPPHAHQPAVSLSSIGAAQLAGDAQADPEGTVRSRMPDPYFNQSELSRQPSDAYDPARRQVNRASELSSLSSGFGDGDIIVPEPLRIRDRPPAPPPPPAASNPPLRQSILGRFSWQRRASARGDRDTVYTEASEDSPPRFRSVASWVNQQTSRIRRAQQRPADPKGDGAGGAPAPGLPNGIPPEEEMNMMMDDGEVPRRPGT